MQFFGGAAAVEATPSPSAPAGNGGGHSRHQHLHDVRVQQERVVPSLPGVAPAPQDLDAHQDQKLMFGLLFSLKSFTSKMDPVSVEKGNLGVPLLPGQGCSFYSFRTNTYKLNLMERPSGIKMILVTHPKTGDHQESLKYIYNLYVAYVIKNPLYVPGTPIKRDVTTLQFVAKS